jgi:hypothetical protein
MSYVARGLAALAGASILACSFITSLDDLRAPDAGGGDAAGMCDGGLASCNGACIDLATDGHNCGACGHDCLGGGCSGSACLPVALATGQASPFGIAVDSQRVYWANNDLDASFASCPLSGCADAGATTLLDKQSLPADVFVANGHLYMTTYGYGGDGGTNGTVLACDPNDCSSTLVNLASEPSSNPVAVVANSTAVFWANSKAGTIGSCGVAGCTTPGTFATDTPTGPWYGLAIAGGSLFWTSHPKDAGAVYSCPLGGCASPTLVASSGGSPFDLAADGTYVYWTTDTGGQVLRCPLAGCANQAPFVVADNQAGPGGIAVDASGVYWLNRTAGTVLRCDTSGCGANGPTVLAGGQNDPWEIVLDATSLYWTSSTDGRIMRLAKP